MFSTSPARSFGRHQCGVGIRAREREGYQRGVGVNVGIYRVVNIFYTGVRRLIDTGMAARRRKNRKTGLVLCLWRLLAANHRSCILVLVWKHRLTAQQVRRVRPNLAP